MLRHYVHTPFGQRRYRKTPVGPYVDPFSAEMERKGFAFETVRTDLKTVAAFGEYLVACDESIEHVTDAHIEGFLAWYRATPRRSGPKRASPGGSRSLEESLVGSLRKLLRFLRSKGVVPAEQTYVPLPPHPDLLAGYLAFLKAHRGFASRTIAMHARWNEALLRKLGDRYPGFRTEELTSEAVETAVADVVGTGMGARTIQMIYQTIEAFVGYLRVNGRISASCRPFLPRRRRYALAALPAALKWTEVERALSSIDRTSALGRRDFAVFATCATYGLRASELVGLRLDDIDWREGSLRVRQFKTRRELHLPLVQPVVDALVSYLRDGRPKDADRHLFQKVHGPRGPMTRGVAYSVIRKALTGAGIVAPHYGPHILRHARATSLVRQGKSLKIVGDLLGHRTPEATIIYCKLAVEDLRDVALELPEASR